MSTNPMVPGVSRNLGGKKGYKFYFGFMSFFLYLSQNFYTYYLSVSRCLIIFASVFLTKNNMRSILNRMLTNRLFLLSLFDIAIISWIPWYESGIEYEPLLDFEHKILTEMGLPTIPLDETIYNIMIASVFINTVVVLFDLVKMRKQKLFKYDLIIAFVYFSCALSCMSFGGYYLSTRICTGIINEYNALFQIPIFVFGKALITNYVSVIGLYIILCIVHLNICMFYLYMIKEKE